MAGRPKVKCFEYNPDGMYLQEYESIAEFKNVYIVSRICNIPHSTLSQRLNPKNNKRNKVNKDNL